MPVYLIADVDVIDRETFEEYRRAVPAVIAAHGGRYLARGGTAETLEGTWTPHRGIILEFPTMAALKAFHDAPEYQPLRAIRARSARSTVVAIEGIEPPEKP